MAVPGQVHSAIDVLEIGHLQRFELGIRQCAARLWGRRRSDNDWLWTGPEQSLHDNLFPARVHDRRPCGVRGINGAPAARRWWSGLPEWDGDFPKQHGW